MRLQADEIVSVLVDQIGKYRDQIVSREVGRVLEVGDGIARIHGLAGVMAGEMVEFTRTKVIGLAFNLEENSVGLIILGEDVEIVKATRCAAPGRCCACRSATRSLAGWSIRWAIRSTARARSSPSIAGRSSRSRPAWRA